MTGQRVEYEGIQRSKINKTKEKNTDLKNKGGQVTGVKCQKNQEEDSGMRAGE